MAGVLTPQQQAAVATYFSQNTYAGLDQTATNGTDVLTTAIGAIDAAVSLSIAVGSASANVSVSLIGNFTAQQLELLMAYVLLKRAGVI